MRILRHYRDVPKEARGTVAALGNFDGVHRGHRALLEKTKRLAHAQGAPFAAFVFEPYPREFFQPGGDPFRLTLFSAKARLLEELGVDILLVFPFDAEFAATPAERFVLDILVGALGVKHVVVGEDFRYGKGRAGDTVALSYLGEMEGFGVTVFPHLNDSGGQKISSSRIRNTLREGHPDQAAKLLGHWWSVEAEVEPGDQRGRTLGFPTANLRPKGTLVPASGIYAVRVFLEDRPEPIDGAASFGTRPMFETKEPLLEVHLFDFEGDLYGKTLRVEFISYLRPELNFDGLDALSAQMEADCVAAKAVLAANPAERALDP